jgi:hypothetical protein
VEFLKGMLDIGYEGYVGYELCHPLPQIEGVTVGLEFAESNARLAAEYMRELLQELQPGAQMRAESAGAGSAR